MYLLLMSKSPRKTLVKIGAGFVIPVGLAMLAVLLGPEPDVPANRLDRARLYDRAGNSLKAVFELRDGLEENKNDIRYNRVFIEFLYNLPEFSSRGHEIRKSDEVIAGYENSCKNGVGIDSVKGCYFLGLVLQKEGDFSEARAYLKRSVEANLEFAAADLGYLYELEGDYGEAERYFRLELQRRNEASRKYAIQGLLRNLAATHSWDDFAQVVEGMNDRESVPSRPLQRYYLATGNLEKYISSIVADSLPGLRPVALVVTILLIGAWLSALFFWRGTSSLPIASVILAVGSGLIMSGLFEVIRNWIHLLHDTTYSSRWWMNAINSYIILGFVPECLKLGSVMLIARRSSMEWRPLHWMLYMAACGLGYAAFRVYQSAAPGEYGDILFFATATIPLHVFLGGGFGLFIAEAEKRSLSTGRAAAIVLAMGALAHGTVYFLFSLNTPFAGAFVMILAMYSFITFLRARPQAQLHSQALPDRDTTLSMDITRVPFLIFGLVVAFLLLYTGFELPRDGFWHTALMIVAVSAGNCTMIFVSSLHVWPEEWEKDWYKGFFGGSGNQQEAKNSAKEESAFRESDGSNHHRVDETIADMRQPPSFSEPTGKGISRAPSFEWAIARMVLTQLVVWGLMLLIYWFVGDFIERVSPIKPITLAVIGAALFLGPAIRNLVALQKALKRAELDKEGLHAVTMYSGTVFIPYDKILEVWTAPEIVDTRFG